MIEDRRTISSAKYVSYDSNVIHCVINSVLMCVPKDDEIREYQLIKKWVTAGNTIAAADAVD